MRDGHAPSPAAPPPQPRYRIGGHWGVTVVAVGDGEPDEHGRRDGDRLLGLMLTPADAELVVAALNATVAWAAGGRRPVRRAEATPSPRTRPTTTS
jgi:hypothetical protein